MNGQARIPIPTTPIPTTPNPIRLKLTRRNQVEIQLKTLIGHGKGTACEKKNEAGEIDTQYLMCQNEGACFEPKKQTGQPSYCVCPKEYTGLLCRIKAFKQTG